MMNTCDTCTFWGETHEWRKERGYRAFIPRCTNKLVQGNKTTGIHRLFTTVGPKFGCIHHEPK